MRGNTELFEVFRGQALNVGGITRFSREFPLGEGWHRLHLVFRNVIVIGTGAGPIADGGLRVIRGITFYTDRGEYCYNAVPGRVLDRLDTIKTGTVQAVDAILAADGTYVIPIDLWFVDPLMRMPVDTILDTSRYSTVNLEITLGPLTDMMAVPGTMTNAPVLDCTIERQRGPVPGKIKPKFFHEVSVRPPMDPTTTTVIDLERAATLAYKRLLIGGTTAGTAIAGVPFSGTFANTIIAQAQVDYDGARPMEMTLEDSLRYWNKQDFSLEALLVGQYVVDFTRDGSINSAIYSGNKSRLRFVWVNGAGGVATAQVSLASEGLRPLR